MNDAAIVCIMNNHVRLVKGVETGDFVNAENMVEIPPYDGEENAGTSSWKMYAARTVVGLVIVTVYAAGNYFVEIR